MAITFDPSAMIVLDAALEVPLFRQIYEQIRGHVLAKRLLPGRRLPSTRVLAARLGVSRTSVTAAYEQLMAEGYLEGRAGSGTFVSAHLPDDLAGHIARPGGRANRQSNAAPHGGGIFIDARSIIGGAATAEACRAARLGAGFGRFT